MTGRDVHFNDIPMAVLDQVENGLRHHFVPIVARWNQKGVPDLKLIGSGTLIDIDGKGYILTAAHVWGATAGADTLHLLMMSGRSLVEIPCPEITARTIWNRQSPDEWGPDLALLEIPPLKLDTIKAHKSLLNFERQRASLAENPPMTEKVLWAIYGVVGESSEVFVNLTEKSLNIDLVARAFFCGITQTHSKADFDYYDTMANLRLPGVPSSFGGVSGGGLWQVGLSLSKSGDYSWDGRRHFRGVAFWQSSAADEQRIVRCHGPISIFERAWSAFGLPVS